MKLRLIIILSIIGLAEYYSFIVVRSAVRNMPPGVLHSPYFICY